MMSTAISNSSVLLAWSTHNLPKFRAKDDGGTALCELHHDSNPSLILGFIAREGYAECKGCGWTGTLLEYAQQTGKTSPHLPEHRSQGNGRLGQVDFETVYTAVDGAPLLKVIRFVKPDGCKTFIQQTPNGAGWKSGGVSPAPLLFAPALAGAPAESPVFIVEGEKAALHGARYGLFTTTAPMGAGAKFERVRVDHRELLRPLKVYILPDNDGPGLARAKDVHKTLAEMKISATILELPGLPPKGDLADWLTGDRTAADLLAFVDQEEAKRTAETWEEPLPLTYETRPEFPIEALPPILRDYVEAVAENCQTPLDLPALSCLSLLASAVHKIVDIETGPGRVFSLNIWALVIYPSGGGKSRVMGEIQAPLAEYERDMQDRITRINEENKRERPVIEDRVKVLGGLKIRTTEEDDELRGLRGKLRDTEELPLPELFTSEATPEALEQKLVEHDGRLAIWNAEGGDFFEILGGRYSSGKSNLGIVLKGFSQESTRIGRILRGTCWIDKPTLTMNLAVQPIVFDSVAKRADFEKRGLIARFLFAYPASMLGYRKTDPKPVDDSVRRTFQKVVRCLLSIQPSRNTKGHLVPYRIELSYAARQKFLAFTAWAEAELRPEQTFCDVKEFGARLVEHMVKIAGLLHCAQHPDEPWGKTVDEETIDRAIALIRWSAEHVRLAMGNSSGDERITRAEYLLEKIKTRPEWRTGFRLRDLFMAVKRKRWYPDQAPLVADLDFLCEFGYLREGHAGNKVGRPARLYQVNPRIFAQATLTPSAARTLAAQETTRAVSVRIAHAPEPSVADAVEAAGELF